MRLRKISLLITTMCLLSACGSAEPTNSNNVAVETETQIMENDTELEIMETENIENETEVVETELTTEVVEKDVISDNIFDFEFLYNGKKIKLPISYKEFSEITGWTLDEALKGNKEEELMMDTRHTYYYGPLSHPNYSAKPTDFDFVCTATFQNLTDEYIHVLDSSVYTVKFSRSYDTELYAMANGIEHEGDAGVGLVESWEEIELSKGITWGSTEEEIVAAYGECSVQEMGRGVKLLTYVPDKLNGACNMLQLYVDEEYGLCTIDYINRQ
ncbi:MAG: hypothetical protein IKW08_04160 [Roseburia sp.]|nr:hypothetical protein [Roseburia sp.]